mgnify:FL=1
MIEEVRDFMEKQVKELLVYDEQLGWKLVKKTMVYEDRLRVKSKSGLQMDMKG